MWSVSVGYMRASITGIQGRHMWGYGLDVHMLIRLLIEAVYS